MCDFNKNYVNAYKYIYIYVNTYKVAGKDVLDIVSDKLSDAFKMVSESDEVSIRICKILSEINVDLTTLLTSLLFNLVNDNKLTLEEVEEKYGENVKVLLDNLIKISKIKIANFNDSSSLYLRKVLVGISDDVRVIIITLAQRLDEMRHLNIEDIEENKRIANETMNVLIPIAHRLGINSIKSELEDLCLRYTKPEVYNEILEKLDGSKTDLLLALDDMTTEIMDILSEHGINYSVKSRVKSVYSIYNKLSTGKKWSDIYDILAMRLIVQTKEDCYSALGLIHSKYKPIPKRFKDYIAMPKDNMYQSLHTSVFGVDGHIFEIQIRTHEMDELAEHGVASHWSYKEHGKVNSQNLMEQKLAVFRNIINIAKEDTNDEIFSQNIKQELLNRQIYVYTPKGDVIEMPKGATPVDFAYRIHSDVGDKMVSAIVNDNIVSLDYELQDGDIIKVNTNKAGKPNKSWLKFVKTAQARNKIKAYFSKKDKEKYIELGKELLEKEIKKEKLNYNEVINDETLELVFKNLKIDNIEDLYLAIGSLRYTTSYIINLLINEKEDSKQKIIERISKKEENKENYKNDVIVAGTDNILINLAKCCSPVYGDEIIGFVTKGEGVSVHLKTCSNIKGISERLINVEWNAFIEPKYYNTSLLIKTNINQNRLLDIVTIASTRNVSINNVSQINQGENVNYQIIVKVQNKNDLTLFMDDVKALSFVIEVIR